MYNFISSKVDSSENTRSTNRQQVDS